MKKICQENQGEAQLEAKCKNQRKTAFTLIEMSIVILIASVLITGLLSASVSSISNANVKLTRERMKEIYKALGNFVAANGRLPCPASLKRTKSSDSDYGKEERANLGGSDICVSTSDVGVYESNGANGRLVYGAVPVKALGLASDMAEDGFGSKLVYVMNQDFAGNFAASVNFGAESFSVASSAVLMAEANNNAGGVLTIQEKYGSSTATASAYAIVSLISYGLNKHGAYNANSNQPNSGSADADEQSNYPSAYSATTADFDATFIAESDSSDSFDDIVQFKTVRSFVEDFNLMFLMPCENASGAGFSGQDAYYGQNVYGSACTPPTNGNYVKKCEAYGRWIDVNVCP